MERSLLSLLFIPLVAMVFLLVWKVRLMLTPSTLSAHCLEIRLEVELGLLGIYCFVPGSLWQPGKAFGLAAAAVPTVMI